MPETGTLLTTPLHALHLTHAARMVPFAGYDMPVQYASGVLKEHLWTRASAGLFDVSHMGQVVIRAKSGRFEDVALALEALVPVDILGLAPGRQRYGFLPTASGGLIDDLMLSHVDDHLVIVVNASRKKEDLAHFSAHLSETCEIAVLDRALVALQGPKAADVLARFAPACADMRFMDIRRLNIMGAECLASRTGYSGEDGFEVSLPADRAMEIVEALIAHDEVQLIGLGARDSLRLEAGLCLYGNDIDETTSPIEASLEWAIQKARRTGGSRAGGFPGADRILGEMDHGARRRRVGLKPEGKAPVRAHAKLYADAQGITEIGEVTSGGFGPSVEAPVAMGYVPVAFTTPGTTVYAEVRGKYLPLTVASLPFVSPTYKR